MSAGRERILGRIRAALESRERLPHPGPSPGVGDDSAVTLGERFARTLGGSGGEVVAFRRPEEAAEWLRGFASAFEGAAR